MSYVRKEDLINTFYSVPHLKNVEFITKTIEAAESIDLQEKVLKIEELKQKIMEMKYCYEKRGHGGKEKCESRNCYECVLDEVLRILKEVDVHD